MKSWSRRSSSAKNCSHGSIGRQKLPKEELNRHRKQDEADTRSFIELLQQQGLLIDRPPELITGVLRALFLLMLHQQEIGEQQFPAIMELLADGLTTEKGKTP